MEYLGYAVACLAVAGAVYYWYRNRGPGSGGGSGGKKSERASSRR